MTATPLRSSIVSRTQPATELVGCLNQLNATLRGIKALLSERMPVITETETNDVY